MDKQRIVYLDAIKGMAIFSIVIFHILRFRLDYFNPSVLNISYPALGAFMIIAGMLSGRRPATHIRSIAGDIINRFMRLVVPAVCYLIILYALHGDYGFDNIWFCFVLFFNSVCFLLLRPAYRQCRSAAMQISVLTAAALTLAVLFHRFVLPLPDSHFYYIRSTPYLLMYFMGVFMGSHYEKSVEIMSRQWVLTLSIIITAASIYYVSAPELDEYGQRTWSLILGVSPFPLIITIFRYLTPRLPASVARPLLYLGRRSLAVYVWHFLFLYNISLPTSWLHACGSALVPTAVVAVPTALAITAFVLLLDYIVGKSPWLSMLLTGGSTDPKPLKVS